MKIFSGRYTAFTEDSFVVFIIGFRINNYFAVHKWIPVAKAMGPMVKELYTHKELGFLHTEMFLNTRGIFMVQYWKTYDQLEKYAHGSLHLKAWKNFNTKIGNNPTVGVYHETCLIDKGKVETIYNNMPKFGLAKAFEHIPITKKTDNSRSRL